MKKYYRRITEGFPQDLRKFLKKKGNGLLEFKDKVGKKRTQIEKKTKKALAKVFISPRHLKKGLLRYFLIFLSLLSLMLIYQVSIAFDSYLKTKEERDKTLQSLYYWEKVLEQHPDYVDAYYEAAVEASKLNEKGKALVFLDKALFYDPLFKEALELKKLLE